MTRARSLATLALAGVAAGWPLPAARANSGFAHERPVLPSGRGAQRLSVDAALLAGARPGGRLADLRLFDRDESEVPYLLVDAQPSAPEWLAGRILATPATKTSSGFELDLGRSARIDRLRLAALPAPWLKRARLEASADRRHWVVLLEQATLFDLPDEQLRQFELAFPEGEFRYLRLAWDDRSSARLGLPPSVAARRVHLSEAIRPLATDVPFSTLHAEPGRSRYRLRLPAAGLPIEALALEGGSGYLLRRACALEQRLVRGQVAPTLLGQTTLRRTLRDDVAAADLSLPLRAPTGREVDLVIDDGNNPPLALSAVRAVFSPQPWIFFESADGAALKARFGHPTRAAPRYDLEAARETIDRLAPRPARWGTTALHLDPPRHLALPQALSAAGAALDASRFRYARALAAGPAGLKVAPLDAAVLAHAHGLRDLRLLDQHGRQRPYLLETRDEPLVLALRAERLASAAAQTSVYRLRLPFAELPPGRLVLTTTARIFQRRVSLSASASAPAPRTRAARRAAQAGDLIAVSDWSSVDPDGAPPALAFDLPTQPAAEVRLTVAEGDNAPLPLATVTLLLPSRRLRFYQPAQAPLQLLYGEASLAPPQYDLSLLGPLVLSAAADEVALGPEQPRTVPSAPDDPARRYFVPLLVGAVLVLLVLIVRLVRKGEAPPA
ncbi:MAG: DUF3999 family protein [Proteobacteria bacterium]|nr:DUF3999 family protein [Pseudomonadota bacterium]